MLSFWAFLVLCIFRPLVLVLPSVFSSRALETLKIPKVRLFVTRNPSEGLSPSGVKSSTLSTRVHVRTSSPPCSLAESFSCDFGSWPWCSDWKQRLEMGGWFLWAVLVGRRFPAAFNCRKNAIAKRTRPRQGQRTTAM